MPTTRKKTTKPIYKDEKESDSENAGDYSDSGSEAKISEMSSSDEADDVSSGDEFEENTKLKGKSKTAKIRKPKLAKTFVNKNYQTTVCGENDSSENYFSIKDLTEADKLLPSILNLSESDSSEDESPKPSSRMNIPATVHLEPNKNFNSDDESNVEYKDLWSCNLQDNSEEIAKKAFLELEQHKTKIEETKVSIQNYSLEKDNKKESDVADLLALGEEVPVQQNSIQNNQKRRKNRHDSDSDMDDWEEVKENKSIPQQGLQLIVDFPDSNCRKRKEVDVEMMMKRKINRVKKEYQVYMHKVHVLCWLAHGNYVSRVLNDQEIMTTALSLVPSKECYPGKRVDMKYLEQITTWFKDKLTLKQDKIENKFKPKAPPLKIILMQQIKSRVVTSKKYIVFIFVSMLRAIGLQCRVVFNFITLPIKPPTSELCSLSMKQKNEKKPTNNKNESKLLKQNAETKNECNDKSKSQKNKTKKNIPGQLDGNDDFEYYETDYNKIMQVDGNDDIAPKTRKSRARNRNNVASNTNEQENGVSPPKKPRKNPSTKSPKNISKRDEQDTHTLRPKRKRLSLKKDVSSTNNCSDNNTIDQNGPSNKIFLSHNTNNNNATENLPSQQFVSPRKTRRKNTENPINIEISHKNTENQVKNGTKSVPVITVTNDNNDLQTSVYFNNQNPVGEQKRRNPSRKRSQTVNSTEVKSNAKDGEVNKSRTKSAPGRNVQKSKYFLETNNTAKELQKNLKKSSEGEKRVSHRDLVKSKPKPKNDVTTDLVDIIKKRVKEAKTETKSRKVKGKNNENPDSDSDYLPEEAPKRQNSESDEDFKPTKISPKPSTSRKIDRRVLSSDDETTSVNKTNVWCEVFVEELEQWIAVDVVTGKVHCTNEIYNRATHPVAYIVGWDNNNYLKDLTRRYVPHWNTVTRKQRVDPAWWNKAVSPWLGPKTARDKEEDEYLDKMQLEAPLPKSIAEYKNHPLYALKRHLLKFEAIYPPDAAVLGYIRGEPVYARECVYVCRSRDIWLKEAKVVRLGEKPYKIVKSRPKWDKLSNKLITDKPLEIFGPWQVQDYEPPVAENGIVPRNAYGNVELFKQCMLPKGTAHIKLPGLNRVAKKLNIDCAPAMTGFEFSGGWSHPVYDGFVVCKEFEEIITEAWIKDQEEQERKEREKIEARVYGNWKRLIKGLLIRERLKNKYGFEEPSTSQNSKKKGPRLVVKKKT